MKRRFVIAVNSATPLQEAALAKFLNDQSVGWWHWLKNVWLVYDSLEKVTAATLRDGVGRNLPKGAEILVIEFSETGSTWAGFGSSNMFEWIKSYWKD